MVLTLVRAVALAGVVLTLVRAVALAGVRGVGGIGRLARVRGMDRVGRLGRLRGLGGLLAGGLGDLQGVAHHRRRPVLVGHGHDELTGAGGLRGRDAGQGDGLLAGRDLHGAQLDGLAVRRHEGDRHGGGGGGAVGVDHEVAQGEDDRRAGLDGGGGAGDRHALLGVVRGHGALGGVLGLGVVGDRGGVQQAEVNVGGAAGGERGVAVGGLGRVAGLGPRAVGQEGLGGDGVHGVHVERLPVDPHAGDLVALRAGVVIGPGEVLGPAEGVLALPVPPVLLEGQLDGGARDVEVGDGVAERCHVQELAEAQAADQVLRLRGEGAAVREAVLQQLGTQATGVGHAEVHLWVDLGRSRLDGVAHPVAQRGLRRAGAAGLPRLPGVQQLLVVGRDVAVQVGDDLGLEVLEDGHGALLDLVHLCGHGRLPGGLRRILDRALKQAGGRAEHVALAVHGDLDGSQVAAGGACLEHGPGDAVVVRLVLVHLVGVAVEDHVHGRVGGVDHALELGTVGQLGGEVAGARGAVVVGGHDDVGGVVRGELGGHGVHGVHHVGDEVALQARGAGRGVEVVGGGADDGHPDALDLVDHVGGEDRLLGLRVHEVRGDHREVGARHDAAEQVVQALVELVVARGQDVEAQRVHHVDRRVVLLDVGHGGGAADQVAGARQQRAVRAVLGLERGAVVLHGVGELRAGVVGGQGAVEVVEGEDRDGLRALRGLDGEGRRGRREHQRGARGGGEGVAAEQAGHGTPLGATPQRSRRVRGRPAAVTVRNRATPEGGARYGLLHQRRVARG